MAILQSACPTSSYPHTHCSLPLAAPMGQTHQGPHTHSRVVFLLLHCPDVNSWLLTFGFQLHNVIPGYPPPDTDAMEPSYELVHTQMKTQEWDNSKVHSTPGRGGGSDILGGGGPSFWGTLKPYSPLACWPEAVAQLLSCSPY